VAAVDSAVSPELAVVAIIGLGAVVVASVVVSVVVSGVVSVSVL